VGPLITVLAVLVGLVMEGVVLNGTQATDQGQEVREISQIEMAILRGITVGVPGVVVQEPTLILLAQAKTALLW
jgi:hypothetical protein